MKLSKLSLLKGILAVMAIFFFAVGVGTMFTKMPMAEADALSENVASTYSESSATLKVSTYTLTYEEKVQVTLAVKPTNVDRTKSPMTLLVFENADPETATFLIGSESYQVVQGDKQATVKGELCEMFYLNGVAPKNLIDDVYVRAYAVVDGVEIYSEPYRINVIEYLHTLIGRNSATAKNQRLYESLLEYATAAQLKFDYKADLVSYTIKYNLDGGTNNAQNPAFYYTNGKDLTLNVPTKDGYYFTGWTGEGVSSPAMAVTIPQGSTGIKTYTANWEVMPNYIEEIAQSTGKVFLDNRYYVSCDNSVVQTDISVYDTSMRQGIVALYNGVEVLDYVDCADTYYLFATEANTAKFYLVFNGSNFIELASVSLANFGTGVHNYKVEIVNKEVVNCYLDNSVVLTVYFAELSDIDTINFHGRAGIYSANGEYQTTNFEKDGNIVGALSLAETKDYIYDNIKSIPVVTYNFYSKYDENHGSIVYRTERIESLEKEDEGVVAIRDIPAMAVRFDLFTNSFYDSANMQTLMEVITAEKSMRMDALKEYVIYNLKSIAKDMYDAIVMPAISTSSVYVAERGTTMSSDLFAKDQRAYLPNSYMLYSGIDGMMGVLDKLETIYNYQGGNYRQIWELTDFYVDEVLRAAAYKGIEYYYWQEYTNNPSSVYNMWSILYNYSGTSDMIYCGEVMHVDNDGDKNPEEYYEWNGAFRLNATLFNSTSGDFADNPQAIVDALYWIVTHQTRIPVTDTANYTGVNYNVNLNTNGGNIDQSTNVTLSANSATDLVLPEPQKDGYEFAGWYESRAYEGNPITAYAKGSTTSDKYLYARWKVGGVDADLPFEPGCIFGNDMVIQRGKPFTVYGTGTDGLNVIVNFNGSQQTAQVSGGKWEVTFESMTASFDPKTLTISADGITYEFTGILIGEVWLGAGQSNMQMPFPWMNGTGVNYVGQYGYHDNFDKIRMYRQQIPGVPFAGDEVNTNKWIVADSPSEAMGQSVYLMSFALNLQKTLGVPVGMITSAQGATYIEEWLSSESIASAGSVLEGALEYYVDENGVTDYNQTVPIEEGLESRYYYGMTELLRGLKIAGVLWYQGENNAFAENYPNLYPNAAKIYDKQLIALHNQYKDVFGNENIPLIITELAPYAWDDYKDFRLVQRATAESQDNMYIVSTVDLGEAEDIHPVYKDELGRRASLIALEFVYPEPGVTDSLNYTPVSAVASTYNGTNIINLYFEDGKTIKQTRELIGFRIKNTSGNFVDVHARYMDNRIILFNTDDAVEVYYMYGNREGYAYLGLPGLYGGNDLPIAPFKIAVS